MKKMLYSFDGGGVLGIGPATYMSLASSSKLLPQPDSLAGTSVGSLLAAAYAKGTMSWWDILITFKKWAPEIFADPGLLWNMNPLKPKYSHAGLKKAVRHIFGDLRMCDLKIPLFVVAMDYGKGKVKVWDSTDGDLVSDCVLTSCSAPTFFPPVNGMVDGGLVANNPAMVQITGCLSKLHWKLEDLWCLSLGTNGDYWDDPRVNTSTTKVEWGKLLLENTTRGNEEMATFQAQALLNRRFLRIEPILSRDYELDDLKKMGEYSDLWAAAFRLHREELIRFQDMFGGQYARN